MRVAQQTTVALLAVGAVALDQRDINECTDYASEVYSTLMDMPTPDPSLYSFLAEQTQLATVTELCQIPQVTGSLAGEYTSYVSSVTSWIGEHSGIIESLVEACSDVPEIQSLLSAMPIPTMCSNISWADGGSDAKTTATDSGNDNSADDGGNAAGRQTVAIGAALAAVGALVVAL
ncbi:uncharacterized protein F5Z01DRAFT_628689 [Emericellopsis atlantica]|uniref:Infection structure specific protein n=1 Tax=Emericellopsis atlantica TaxID=2614577 RepID=A0A9P8CMK7_9HYPO|nr:uncharacterized protein F5Z01DRAFT_628689 [Emericellopsis atlantica]KAG9250786.1 hypothetical protein F5Z01DRAFT_628689 [Emericellopsis atlantica]